MWSGVEYQVTEWYSELIGEKMWSGERSNKSDGST